jgi:hypothetical protein
VGSVVQWVLPHLRPGRASVTWFRVCRPRHPARLRLGFPAAARQRRLARRGRQVAGSLCKRHAVRPDLSAVALPPLVGAWFQVHYPPLSGFFPSFARATVALSVAREYLALRDGPRGFGPTSTCWVVLRIPPGRRSFRVRDFHPVSPAIPRRSAMTLGPTGGPTTPPGYPGGLGSSAFARRY